MLDSALVAIERMLTDIRSLTLQRDRMRSPAPKRVAPRVAGGCAGDCRTEPLT